MKEHGLDNNDDGGNNIKYNAIFTSKLFTSML